MNKDSESEIKRNAASALVGTAENVDKVMGSAVEGAVDTTLQAVEGTAADAWNPGLQSDIPTRLWPLVTLFRPEHAFVSHSEALELSDLTGLHVLELVCLRPARLLSHALLVRVTADLSVPDGPNYEDLGINLRGMVSQLMSAHMNSALPQITSEFDEVRRQATTFVLAQLSEHFNSEQSTTEAPQETQSFLSRWIKRSSRTKQEPTANEIPEIKALAYWKEYLVKESNPLHKACLNAIVKTVGSVVAHRGRMLPDHPLIARIIVNQVSNTYGAQLVDEHIDKRWYVAIETEGYRLLPIQAKPFIMNVKGASASGKSTIRPQQRQLAEKLGIPWDDFALISPDYWRKYLLEYNSLGKDYKYGAMLTGWELEVIDKKLDRYMAKKAANGSISHLLIDRFRFDSFTVDVDRAADSTLLSRFGDQVFLYFMVTHPAETVSRAFLRGQTTGRYKAVDDLLHHNVEAFTGMPALFLSWVNSTNKRVHFEFLDNDVPKGELPKTAAFGWNKTLVILDINLVLNIDRYRKVNISAKNSDEIFTADDLEASSNTSFIKQCTTTVNNVIFADQDTATEYAEVIDGKLVWCDHDYIKQHNDSINILITLTALGYKGHQTSQSTEARENIIDVEAERLNTVGQWYMPVH